MASEPTIQSGSVTMTGASVTDSLTSVTTANSVLFFSHSGANPSSPKNQNVKGVLTSSTLITFTRDTASADIEIQWFVVEWSSGVSVQRGASNISSTPKDHTITSVGSDTTESFPITSNQKGGTGYGTDDPHKTWLTSTTNLRVESNTATSDHEYAYQVVTYTNASVQTSEQVASTSDTSKDWTISTAVTLARTFPLFTMDIGGSAGCDDFGWRGRITDTTSYICDKSSSGVAADLRLHVVELPSGEANVQHVDVAFGGSESPIYVDDTVTAITVANTLPISSGWSGGQFGKSSVTADDYERATGRFVMTSTTNLRTHMAENTTVDFRAHVIDFTQSGGAPTAKSGTSTVGVSVSGALDALFGQTTRTATISVDVDGTLDDLFSQTTETATASVEVDGILDEIFGNLTTLTSTANVAVDGGSEAISSVLTDTGTIDVAASGAVVTLEGLSQLAATIEVAVVGTINDMFGDTAGASTIDVSVVGTIDQLLVDLATQNSTVSVEADGSLASLIVALDDTGSVGVSVVGTLNDLFSVLTTLSSTANISVIGVVPDLLVDLPTANSDVNVTVGGTGIAEEPGGPGPASPKRKYFFGFGHGYGE